ncbi:kinesin family member 1B [Thecamonas trahens ATCC 50062]|uniref:Kinesin-like protein n=1 Tax=Thecamonas trahens ATCC 50062 TaxID=461836 RepID=A0A0L0DXB6_THETB|nr:kinesin family member 1B [Thecamonas trahens ATCC 50062]KNC56173.1 kinesin family member 1B [Thecamonas trahens ATCC 50062]|eukprot:XP_013761209.1 kinesin family member 1B [Thecamonas trahens ATCC 50062]
MSSDTVQIAVRMRPFNAREKKLKTAKCVDMVGQMCTVTDPESGKERQFSFNYCYDSFEPGSENFASQEIVFHDLGTSYLENAWKGYNCSIFAYGQTGAGKSYSMTGAPGQPGIIPRGLAEMFRRIDANDDPDLSFRVEVSYLEIYMEKIRDLFNPKQAVPSLKVRESPKLGIFVEGLKKKEVGSYADVERLMEMGNTLRTVAQTNMNATSSRSHSVLTVLLTQTRIDQESMTASDMTSKINLIDLAGSERQNKTGASGQRLKEGSAINQSLTALGNVIETLADLSQLDEAKRAHSKRVVPYRDSKLTRILQESLGGNAKTIMVAAISPAADNFPETLSTLRYANRASKIQNVAVINESPNEKVIRELKEEVTRLREMLATGGIDVSTGEPVEAAKSAEMEAELLALREQLSKQSEFIQMMGLTAEDREAFKSRRLAADMEEMEGDLRELHGIDFGVEMTTPHLVNLNNVSLAYSLDASQTSLGRSHNCDIVLGGVLVQPEHCSITNEGGVYTVVPSSATVAAQSRDAGGISRGGVLFLNGELVVEPVQLAFGDRLVVGNNHYLMFEDPAARETAGDAAPVFDIMAAVNELRTKDTSAKIEAEADETEDESTLREALERSLADVRPALREANAIARAMGRSLTFESAFVYDMSAGVASAATTLNVKVVPGSDDSTLDEPRTVTLDDFENRLDRMKDVYHTLQEYGADVAAKECALDDPFHFPPEDERFGLAHVLLLALTEGIPVGPAMTTPIWDGDGGYLGTLQISIWPATADGAVIEYSELPEDWLLPGTTAHVIVALESVTGLAADHTDIYLAYTFPGAAERVVTPLSSQVVTHDFDHEALVPVKVTESLLEAFMQGELVVEVWSAVEA